MTITVRAAAGSDTGQKYQENYDVAHLVRAPLLAVVADGMGAGPGSAMAGRTAVDLLAARAGGTVDDLAEAVATAHERVGEFGREHGMLAGCTLTALAECADGTWLVQLGDSRAYRLRDDLVELLTVDHTMAWLGVLHGAYPLESPGAHRDRYRLTRYVGHRRQPPPDLLKLDLRAGDALLLCTDGIADQVPYDRIAEALRAEPDEAVARLLADAEAAGGKDNATAVVVRVG